MKLFASGKLALSVNYSDFLRERYEELQVDASTRSIGFNSRYLLDIAAQIEGDVAVLRLADLDR